MTKGSIISVVLPGDLGKPRPALIMQSEILSDVTSSVIILPFTSTIRPTPLLRITVLPSASNGLRVPSQVMIDRITNVKRDKIGGVIGQMESETLLEVTRRLLSLLGVN